MDNTYISLKKEIESLIEQLNLEEAKHKIEKLLKTYPNQVELYDLYSEILISLNYIKEAKTILEKSITINPYSNGDKYMTLGQLYDKPIKKLELYNKGVEVMKHKLALLNNTQQQSNSESYINKEKEELILSITSGLSSISELYMTTELCDSPNAELTCENMLKEAYALCDYNVDVLVQYSNLRILRKRDKEAKDFMDKAYSLILSIKESDKFPDADIIFSLAKNYSELEDYYNAVKLYDILIQLDDDNPEYWYYNAFNHYKLKNYIYCQNCIDRLSQVISNTGYVDSEMSEAVKELQNEVDLYYKVNGKLTNGIFEGCDEDEDEEIDEEHRTNSMNVDYD